MAVPAPTRSASFGRWLARRWWAFALAAAMLYGFPHYPSIRSANELPRVYLVLAMVEDGTFAIDRGIARWGSTADVSPHGGHHYSNKAPGSSLLAVPAYLALRTATRAIAARDPTLGELLWTFRLATGVLPTLGFLWLLWGFLARFAPSPHARRATLTLYALGSMALTYSILFIAHQLAAVCIGAAWILAVWVADDDRDPRWMLLAGFLAGAAPLMDYQAAFAGLPVAGYVGFRLIRTRRGAVPFALAVLGAALPIATLLLYHHACFGSPWRTGYAASTTFAHFHQRGFLGLDQLRWSAFVGSTVAPDNGLLVFCPGLVLALPGWWRLARGAQRGAVWIGVAVTVIYLLFISGLVFWRGGWQVGPRYITAMLPFVLPGIAAGLQAFEGRPVVRGVGLGLIGVGVFVYAGSRVEFPHFPEKFRNPIYEVTLRLLSDGLAAPNPGQWLHLPGAWSLLPYAALLAVIWGRVIWVGSRPRERAGCAGIALAVTAGVVLAYGQFPGGGAIADRAYLQTVRPAVEAEMRR